MEIKSSRFVTSMSDYRAPAEGFGQIAMCGRSNVGKSSLINCLCRRSKLAKVGAAPGKTRLINFFAVNEGEEPFFLVDLPGYGFAKADKQEIARWGAMMDKYFTSCDSLKGVIHVVDIRHEPTRDDIQMKTFLRQCGIPFVVAVNKADKISRGARQKYLAPILRALQVQPWQTVVFSAEDETGREDMLLQLEKMLRDEN